MNVVRYAVVVLGLAMLPTVAQAQGVHGVLRVVKGDVKIKSGASGQANKARIGEKVYPKDIILTAKDSRAKIVMVDNNEINVSPESQIEIQNYEYDPNQGKKNVLLNVIYGKVRSKVEQKYDGKGARFQIKTPSAVAGVRGTDFLTSYDRSNNSSSVITFEGRVEFGLPGPNGTIQNPVFVNPGSVASNQGFTPPTPPVPVPQEELAKMDTESKNPSNDGVKNEEPRMPAGQEKKEEKKDDKKSDVKPAGPGAAAPGTPGPKTGEAAPAPRDPAAVGGGDFRPPPPPPAPPLDFMPPPVVGPPPVFVNPNPTNDFIRGVIENGNTNLIIKVNN